VDRTIVVGVDGSAAAEAALRWATEEARLRGARLHVVHAWAVPASVGAAPYVNGLGDELRETAELLVDAVVRDLVDDGLQADGEAVAGRAAEALLEAAADASLLVVGSRGRGGFAGLLLGSVSQQCVHHAACPVVVVHASPE
jgi:nucleotide-binding universal stress UspA family protein